MKYIKAITWSIVLLIVLVALFAVIKIWGITLPEGWNMSVHTLVNIIITVGIADFLLILLLIFIPFATHGSQKEYDENSGKVAQRKERLVVKTFRV